MCMCMCMYACTYKYIYAGVELHMNMRKDRNEEILTTVPIVAYKICLLNIEIIDFNVMKFSKSMLINILSIGNIFDLLLK